MKEILFFIIGNVIAIFYFSHLYFQLANLGKRRKISFYFTFPLRFSVLSILLGILFLIYGSMAVYSIIGIVTGRFVVLSLVRKAS